jgi:hypothetical protein
MMCDVCAVMMGSAKPWNEKLATVVCCACNLLREYCRCHTYKCADCFVMQPEYTCDHCRKCKKCCPCTLDFVVYKKWMLCKLKVLSPSYNFE